MRVTLIACALASALSFPPLIARAADAAATNTDAVIKKIDGTKNTLTLAHGPIENLAMPSMTMSFQIADPALLKGRKPGEKVKVRIEEVGGKYTVVRLIPAP
jgi:Cu(I)/Ag(I) efflux system protein CusF